jgi:hypothetical protein
MSLLPHRSSIRRLRARSAPLDVANVGARIERAFQTIDFNPSSLPSGALLCVRQLKDPLPGRLTEETRSNGEPQAWNHAMQQRLDELLRSATQPVRGRLPSAAAAVYFANEAELLRCLAMSQSEHRFLSEWWWSDILGKTWTDHPWHVLWRQSPKAIPGALILLAEERQLAAAVSTLTAPSAHSLARTVAQTFGLNPALAGVSGRPACSWSKPPEKAKGEEALSRDPSPISEYVIEIEAFLSAVPEIDFPLWLPEIRVFLLLGLLLPRRPALARVLSPQLLAQVIKATSAATTISKPPDTNYVPKTVPPPETIPKPAAETPPDREATAPRYDTIAAGSQNDAGSQTPRPPLVPSSLEPPLQPRPFGETIRTRYGGVLYLLNVALHLGLYSDFTQPRGFNLQISPWDFIAELAKRLLPDPDPEDALWPCLGRLSGRAPDEALDAQWETPSTWRLPPDWSDQKQVASPASVTFAGWCDWLAPIVLRRLKRATGLSPAEFLCYHAWMRSDADRFEAHFSLSNHPLELRTAGLDRDPGWIPATGRSVFFHYD